MQNRCTNANAHAPPQGVTRSPLRYPSRHLKKWHGNQDATSHIAHIALHQACAGKSRILLRAVDPHEHPPFYSACTPPILPSHPPPYKGGSLAASLLGGVLLPKWRYPLPYWVWWVKG